MFNYAYLSAQTYREHLYEDPEYNTLYMTAHEDADPYEEGAGLLEDGPGLTPRLSARPLLRTTSSFPG